METAQSHARATRRANRMHTDRIWRGHPPPPPPNTGVGQRGHCYSIDINNGAAVFRGWPPRKLGSVRTREIADMTRDRDARAARSGAGHGLEHGIELGRHRGPEMSLRVGRRQPVHHFPAMDQHAGVIEGASEIRSRPQRLLEQGVAVQSRPVAQPKDVFLALAAVSTIVSSLASGCTNTPPKQADTITTRFLIPSLSRLVLTS